MDLSCFLVLGSHERAWWALNRRKRMSSLYGLEIQYRSVDGRDRILDEAFDRALRTRRTVTMERFGFCDLLVPVVRGRLVLGFLEAGAFARQAPDLATLERVWKELSGLEASHRLPEFRDFVRTALEIPVLDGPLMPALQEALELFAGLLAGQGSPRQVQERTRTLQNTVFARGLPHSYWLDWALGRPTSESVPAWDRRVESWRWTREEIGLTRMPTTVLVVMPRIPQRGESWVGERLRLAAYQRLAFKHAQALPQTVAGRLDDYGAVYVSSTRPGLSRLARRRELESLAREVRDFAQRELGVQVLVSVGETVAPGESLRPSFRDAFLSLHTAAASSQGIVFAGEAGGGPPRSSAPSLLLESLEELARALAGQSSSDLAVAQEQYIARVLELSIQSAGETRLHLQYALARVCTALEPRLGLGPAEGRRLRESAAAELDAAANVQEMVAAFRDAMARLREEPSGTRALKRRLGIESALASIDERPGDEQPLSRLAALAGLSVSAFSREFRRRTGKGFEAHLQERRLELARRLLRGGNLPVSQIARECGFRSASYFSRLFRARVGNSPDAFRRAVRRPTPLA